MRKLYSFLFCTGCMISQYAYAQVLTCPETFLDKPFAIAIIMSGVDGFGPVECGYKSNSDTEYTYYKLPPENDYYVVSGIWHSAMPGTQWCTIEDGSTYDTCRFALRIT